MNLSLASRSILVIGWIPLLAMLSSVTRADEDCLTSSKIVVVKQSGGTNKGDNSSPANDDGDPPATGVVLYVTDRISNELTCHDQDLDPFDVIDGPGGAGATHTGFAISGALPMISYNWFDQSTSTFFRTTPGGTLLLAAPLPPLGPVRGMCFDPNRNSFWLCRSDMGRFFEITPAGVPTGDFFDSPGGPGGTASGVSFCHDTGHLMIGYGAGGTITTLARVFYDGTTFGVGIDVTDLNLTDIGFTHVTVGSNGTPSVFITDMAANLNIEINAPVEEDCDLDGISDACQVQFTRGDCNDDTAVNLGDAIRVLSYLFAGTLLSCESACDINDNGGIQIDDAISLMTFLFVPGSPPPPEPFSSCGVDCTPDAIECTTFATCP